jgi:uncharacterized membrane protein YwaF
MLYFASVTELLVTETNRHYHQYFDRPDETPTPLPLTTNSEMLLFIAIIVQMGHAICDRLRDYWTRTEQFFTHFCPIQWHEAVFCAFLVACTSQTMTNKSTITTKIMTLWKIREIFEMLNVAYPKF